MNKIIYKYQLNVETFQDVLLPIGAEILTIIGIDITPYLYALVDPDQSEKENIAIELYGTGEIIQEDIGISRKYISTFQLFKCDMILHAFVNTGVYKLTS